MNKLVQRLSQREHPVTIGGPPRSLKELQRRVEQIGYVFIKFTDTQGETNLCVEVDKIATDLSKADFDRGEGTIHVEGNLTLDYVKVRCIADLDVVTLGGTGHLMILEEAHP